MTNPATIYRYDITADGKGLENRRLFAFSPNGIPDGIHTDTNGNVYSSCADGIHVCSPEGVPIGKFVVPGTQEIANFAWFPGGIYVYDEKNLWKITINAEGRQVRRDFGLT
jgi:gluconolactonase